LIVLVSGATATHRQYWDNPNFGHLISPRSGNSIRATCKSGKPWAADNDAFGGWTREKELSFSKMLGRICLDGNKSTCKFIACPDVVGDSKTTLERFDKWESIVRATGFPVALVAQDGLYPSVVPWNRIDALFIGGTTEWKLSSNVDWLIAEAQDGGVWVHVGRVNSARRIRHFYEVGVDSIDGRSFSAWPDLYFARFLKWMDRLHRQPVLGKFGRAYPGSTHPTHKGY
jgi:hypothetical protein